MACCGSKPKVTLIKSAAYRPVYDWHDRCTSGTPSRQVQWWFYRNSNLVYVTDFGGINDPLAIGTNSNYSWLNATEAQIVAFLNAQGAGIVTGDRVHIRVRIRNCDKEFAVSNPLSFLAPEVQQDCVCSFIRAYSIRQTGLNPVPPSGFTPTGGQLLFVNGLLTNGMITEPLVEDDELMWVTLDNTCEDQLVMESVTGQVGNISVPTGFLNQVSNSAQWLVARNGLIQTGYVFAAGQLVPAVASSAEDEWLFIGLAGGDCALRTVLVGTAVSGGAINLPLGFSSANAARFIPVRDGLMMFESIGSESGYTISGTQLIPDVPFDQEDIWLITIA